MAWSIISPLMPFISQDVDISPGQISVILAIPVILGSVLRVPFGYLTNIVGAKWVFSGVLLYYYFQFSFRSSSITRYANVIRILSRNWWRNFSVGVTSVPKYFSKDKVGLANGIYGVGNIGTAVSSFCAPVLAGAIGWQNTVRSYLIILSIFAILMFLGDKMSRK